jgi:hypothetical protein
MAAPRKEALGGRFFRRGRVFGSRLLVMLAAQQ